MRKLPRGVYYLSLGRILRSSLRALTSSFPSGKTVRDFEKAAQTWLDTAHVKAMPHARISLYYLLKAYGLQAGDEVLMSPVTLPDMVNMILILGLKPVFIDFKDNSYAVDLEKAKSLLSPGSRVLFLTHLYGILPNLEEAQKFCARHGLKLIQDCTQSYGCKFDGRALTQFADSSFFSTCSLKDLHTHMGALLCTDSESLFKQVEGETQQELRRIERGYFFKFLREDIVAAVGLNPAIFSLLTYHFFKIIYRVNPRIIENFIDGKGIRVGPFLLFKGLFGGSGYRRRSSVPPRMLYRFTDLQAEVGLGGLAKIDVLETRRRANTLVIIDHLSDRARSRLPRREARAFDTFWRLPILVDDPDDFGSHLLRHGIDPGRTTLPCLPNLPIFREFKGAAPVAEKMVSHSVFIPNYPYMTTEELVHVAKTVNAYFEN